MSNLNASALADNSTLAQRTGHTGAALKSLTKSHKRFVLTSRVLHADGTPVATLDPGRGKIQHAYVTGESIRCLVRSMSSAYVAVRSTQPPSSLERQAGARRVTDRTQTDAAFARVVKVFGETLVHQAYLFANARANRMKVLVHDGPGLCLCLFARRLHQGRFCYPASDAADATLSTEQLAALAVGLPANG
ncbi:MAG: hypothetical protein EOO38_04040 [Cytophagaceae bacterium]|nr:MAG: hypothetical protein EOO38_04040 [Cytophagaceae bacterium]